MNKVKQHSLNMVKEAVKAIDDKMGFDIKVIEIGDISSIADYFVIASANNENQLKAILNSVEERLFKKLKVSKKHLEGVQTKSWVLIDFNDVVVHIFNKESRDFYNLERIWADAKFIDIKNL